MVLVFGMNKMTNKHTPAPWHITADGYNVKNETDIMICVNSFEDDVEQCKYNAKLIAAAPDLLGILQIMAEKDFEFSEYECRLARAAITKATGDLKWNTK